MMMRRVVSSACTSTRSAETKHPSYPQPFRHGVPIYLAAAALALAGFGGCGGDAPDAGAATGAALLPAGLFLDSEPTDPPVLGIVEAKRQAREGDRVAVRGRIGGTRDPFVNGRAVMTIVDLALPTCADKPDDCCETPWDYCCEERSEIVAHAATVRIIGAEGGLLRANLQGAGGLKPMAEVVIVGRVGQTASPTAFVVEAEGIYVK